MTKQEWQDEQEAREWRSKKVRIAKAKVQQTAQKKAQKHTKNLRMVQTYLESNAPRNQIASVNLKKSADNNLIHNDRTQPPSYLLESGGLGIECNRTHQEAQDLREQIILKAQEAYQANCKARNKNFQAKSYLWSAVVNLKPDSTMEQLEQFAQWVEKFYGFQCYQIAIHRDEGFIDENKKEQINHHAHLEFVTLDKETGKNLIRNIYRQPIEMKKWQTRIANILQMKRGTPKAESERERIEPRLFGKIAEQIKAKSKTKELENLQIQSLQAQISTFKAQLADLEAQRKAMADENKRLKAENAESKYSKADYDEINRQKREVLLELEQVKKNLSDLKAKNTQLESDLNAKEKAFLELKGENEHLKQKLATLENEKRQSITQSNKNDLRAISDNSKPQSTLSPELEKFKLDLESKTSKFENKPTQQETNKPISELDPIARIKQKATEVVKKQNQQQNKNRDDFER